jgi:hypothetical protein
LNFGGERRRRRRRGEEGEDNLKLNVSTTNKKEPRHLQALRGDCGGLRERSNCLST